MCLAIADGGKRCPGFHSAKQVRLTTYLMEAEEHALNVQAAKDAAEAEGKPAVVIDALNRQVDAADTAVATAKADVEKAHKAWLQTPAGIKHLREVAADESLSPKVRETARLDAERYATAHNKHLQARTSRYNRDVRLNERLAVHGVPKDRRDEILAMTQDSTYGDLYVVGSKKARIKMDEAELDRDQAVKDAGRNLSAVRDRLLADAEADGSPITAAEAKAHPDYQEAMRAGYVAVAQATDARNEARARYYQSPEGVAELQEQLAEAKAKAAASAAELNTSMNVSSRTGLTPVEEYRAQVSKALDEKRYVISRRAQDAMKAAIKNGDVAHARQIEAKRKVFLAQVDDEVNAAVAAKVKELNAPLYQQVREDQINVAALQSQVDHYSGFKQRATDNKMFRVARENAIRDAVIESGGTREDADLEVAHYRRDRKNVDRRYGGTAPMDPINKKTKTVGVHLTASEHATLVREAQAESELIGKNVSVALLLERRASEPPQSYFEDNLGEVQKSVLIGSNGRPHRQRTMLGGEARDVQVVYNASPAHKARLETLAETFGTGSQSSFVRHMGLKQDPRAIQNDRSSGNRDLKESSMWRDHADAEQSKANTPA